MFQLGTLLLVMLLAVILLPVIALCGVAFIYNYLFHTLNRLSRGG